MKVNTVRRKTVYTAIIIFAALISACSGSGLSSFPVESMVSESGFSQTDGHMEATEEDSPPEISAEADSQNYVQITADEILSRVIAPGMTEPDKARAVYDYIIENTVFAEPVGLDIWRVRSGVDVNTPIPFLENRALSVLVFGIGSCEDYAAALTLLLRRAGIEAEYVPGLTISVDGGFVDHAWTMAKIGGKWFHLDCQLEYNIMKSNTIAYHYFMKSDKAMLASHRWGESLIDYGGFTGAQVEEIRKNYIFEKAHDDYPAPEPRKISPASAPDMVRLSDEIVFEIEKYEAAHGPLAPLDLNISPPVFHGKAFP